MTRLRRVVGGQASGAGRRARGIQVACGRVAIALLVGLWLSLGAARPVAAQELWLATEVQIGGETADAGLTSRVADSLRKQGRSVMSAAAATTELAARHSRASVRPSDDEQRQLDGILRELADHL